MATKSQVSKCDESSDKCPLENRVEVDEFLVGGFDESLLGKSNESKQLVILGVEKLVDKNGKEIIGRA